jgi:ATP-dependent RNA helicase DeaD
LDSEACYETTKTKSTSDRGNDNITTIATQVKPSHPHRRANQKRTDGYLATLPNESSGKFFGKLAISHPINKALEQIGYSSPTPIQEEIIPMVRAGRDVIGQAQTGTGKTAAFGIPIAEAINPNINAIQALILVPTRELAVQVRLELSRLGSFTKLKSVAIYGGQPIARQLHEFQKGPNVIVATPGRLLDHMGRGNINFHALKFVVLDEADQMLDIGFAEDINRILRGVPRSRQTLLFSATMPDPIKRLARRYMKNPLWAIVGGNAEPVDQVEQIYYEVAERDRYGALQELLNQPDYITQALIFRRTRIGVDKLVNYLKRFNYDIQGIHGDITQVQRDAVMAQFRSKHLRVLVATNLAARGLDIPAVSHVVNYDMPDTVEDYIHRIGRTARMGKPGTAITFVSEWDFQMLDTLQSHVGGELKGKHLNLYKSKVPR